MKRVVTYVIILTSFRNSSIMSDSKSWVCNFLTATCLPRQIPLYTVPKQPPVTKTPSSSSQSINQQSINGGIVHKQNGEKWIVGILFTQLEKSKNLDLRITSREINFPNNSKIKKYNRYKPPIFSRILISFLSISGVWTSSLSTSSERVLEKSFFFFWISKKKTLQSTSTAESEVVRIAKKTKNMKSHKLKRIKKEIVSYKINVCLGIIHKFHKKVQSQLITNEWQQKILNQKDHEFVWVPRFPCWIWIRQLVVVAYFCLTWSESLLLLLCCCCSVTVKYKERMMSILNKKEKMSVFSLLTSKDTNHTPTNQIKTKRPNSMSCKFQQPQRPPIPFFSLLLMIFSLFWSLTLVHLKKNY